jgi:nucleoside-diphosphate-sugar epimerase
MKRSAYRTAQASQNSLARDLDHVLAHTAGIWDELRGKRIFVTGGTGFFGTWLLESFARANERLDLQAEMTVLTRNPDAFRRKAPFAASSTAIRLVRGDVLKFRWPQGEFHSIIHGASATTEELDGRHPLLELDTTIQGTRNVLDFARERRIERVLFLSSGAVYGRQTGSIPRVPEEYVGAPRLLDGAEKYPIYGEAKRIGELLCSVYWHHYGIESIVARCFAFVGPYLNLNLHYAAGNFIRDGLKGGPISVSGDGTPYRSYLYASDLTIWLWHILMRGAPGTAYNVGSEEAVTIRELADRVAHSFDPPVDVKVQLKPDPRKEPERYVPSTERARTELGLQQHVTLEEAIRKTIGWNKAQNTR